MPSSACPRGQLASKTCRPRELRALLLLGRARELERLGRGVAVRVPEGVHADDQRLQRRADVVELDLLRVQRAARGLAVVLQLLAALVGAVAVAHRYRPDAARHAAEHGVLRVHAVAEEERQVRREVVDVHAAREVRLDEREAVRQRERELRDRVRAGLGDVVARDRHRVEVPHVVVDEVRLDVAPSPSARTATRSPQIEKRSPSGPRAMGWRSSAAVAMAAARRVRHQARTRDQGQHATRASSQPGRVHYWVRPNGRLRLRAAPCTGRLLPPAGPCQGVEISIRKSMTRRVQACGDASMR